MFSTFFGSQRMANVSQWSVGSGWGCSQRLEPLEDFWVKLPRPRSATTRRPPSAPRRAEVEWRAPPQEVPKEVLSKVLSLVPSRFQQF